MKTFATHLEAIAADRPTAVYRFYSAKGRLLYVGITFNLATRFAAHQRLAKWWSKQERVAVAWFDTRAEAAAEERRAIRTEKPLSNIAGTRRQRASCRGPRVSPVAREAIACEVRGEVARYRFSTLKIAEELGVSRNAVRLRLTARVPFRPGELDAIADLLGISIAKFEPRQVPA